MHLPRLRATLALLFIVGLLLVALGEYLAPENHFALNPLPLAATFVRNIGVACFIALLLAVTIDARLKHESLTDVTRASLGYLLPSELREELLWVFDQRFICTDHLTIYDVTLDTSELVRVHVEERRTNLNFSADTQEIQLRVTRDDYQFPGKSTRIVSYKVSTSTGNYRDLKKEYEQKPPRTEGHDAREQQVLNDSKRRHIIDCGVLSVPSQSKATFVTQFEFSKRNNDEDVVVYTYPTRNPRLLSDTENCRTS